MKTTSKLIAAVIATSVVACVALASVGVVGFAKAAATATAGETRTGTTLPGFEFNHNGEHMIVLNTTVVTP
jgi:hypothetical protein